MQSHVGRQEMLCMFIILHDRELETLLWRGYFPLGGGAHLGRAHLGKT